MSLVWTPWHPGFVLNLLHHPFQMTQKTVRKLETHMRIKAIF